MGSRSSQVTDVHGVVAQVRHMVRNAAMQTDCLELVYREAQRILDESGLRGYVARVEIFPTRKGLAYRVAVVPPPEWACFPTASSSSLSASELEAAAAEIEEIRKR